MTISGALAVTSGVFVLLAAIFAIGVDSRRAWGAGKRLALFGWIALGIGAVSALAAAWTAVWL